MNPPRVPVHAPRRPGLGMVAAILLGNLIPVAGVLRLGWSAGQILILYWLENLVIGLFALPRILTAQGADGLAAGTRGPSGRVGAALFFVAHYGLFWIVHGVFAALLAYRLSAEQGGGAWAGASFGAAGLALFVHHALDFRRRWLRTDARATATPIGEMFRPYGRLIVLHLTVLLGAFGLAELGAPAGTVALLCLGKAVLELGAEMGSRLFRPTGKPDAYPPAAD